MIEKAVPILDELKIEGLSKDNLSAAVLRLDLLHPLVSGNKWYKLNKYLQEVKEKNCRSVLSFGGAYSNHILAMAAACKEKDFISIGIIRGEQPANPSSTLLNAAELGMHLFYISREDYREKKIPPAVMEQFPSAYIINEGGYGHKGMMGAKDILAFPEAPGFTHILTAVGTGTTLAGLTAAAREQQQLIGISVLKNNFDLQTSINDLLGENEKNRFTLLHQYNFGGYAKHTDELIEFMNSWYRRTGIPSDFVYTGKLFYAFNDLLGKGFFPPSSRILLIHSGGLQGNHSLRKGTLIF